MKIRQAQETDLKQWHRMRLLLWPGATQALDKDDMREYLSSTTKAIFVAENEAGRLIGFLEANIRAYADGCETRNVGYIEGWFVDEEFRRQGVGAALVNAAENWARAQGCLEMGSDCLQDNEISLAAHLALGYREKERLIHYCKAL